MRLSPIFETVGQTVSNIVYYTVTLTIDQTSIPSNVYLYPGVTATANITVQQRIGTLLIPESALTFPTTAAQAGEIDRNALKSLPKNNRYTVLELQQGKLMPVLITIGIRSGMEVEVLSGLQGGDQVVIGQTGGKSGGNSSRS